MVEAAQTVAVGDVLAIELREDDPAFILDGAVLGWLADNIAEVTVCLEAGWRYDAEVTEATDSPAGPVIKVRVHAHAPAS